VVIPDAVLVLTIPPAKPMVEAVVELVVAELADKQVKL
jgi:hypothetical protein